MIFKKKKKYITSKKAFERPFKHRFTFVPKGTSYYGGFTVCISEKIIEKKQAFYYASSVFLNNCKVFDETKSVAVFYGKIESPDSMDELYGAFSSFDKIKKKIGYLGCNAE